MDIYNHKYIHWITKCRSYIMNVKKIVKEKNIDTHQLARDLDISYTYADLLINSKRIPSITVMKKIREVYKLPLREY